MNLITKIVLITFLLIVGKQSFIAQNEDVISQFSATEFSGKVLLSWEILQGNTCNGVEVHRSTSTDSANFKKIGSIEGICGSTTASIKYSFTDLFPVKNEINYYRLSLGGIGFSWIVSAEVIDVGENNYILRPNPINSTTELLFNNDSGKEFKLNVYDFNGQISGTYFTTSEVFFLDQQSFSSGMYFFEISSEETSKTVKGKLNVP